MDNGESSYRRFLAGDNEGLHEIICTYRSGLILYLNSFVQNVHTAEELTQDVFLELVIKRQDFQAKAHSKYGSMRSGVLLLKNTFEGTQNSASLRRNHRNTLLTSKISKAIT